VTSDWIDLLRIGRPNAQHSLRASLDLSVPGVFHQVQVDSDV
jgi:hypothetical protein